MSVIIVMFGAAAGVILGIRHFKVLALLPVILLIAAVAIAHGVAARLDALTTAALVLLAAVASPQIGYLIGSVAASYIVRRVSVHTRDREGAGGASHLWGKVP